MPPPIKQHWKVAVECRCCGLPGFGVGLLPPPPVLLRLTTDGRCCWVLELQPIRRAARPVVRAQPLGDNPLASQGASVSKHGRPTVVLQMFVQSQARSALAQDARQRRLADLDWLPPQIGAVEFQKIEGVEEGAHFIATAAEHIEPRQPALIATDNLAINQAGPNMKVVDGFDDEREALRPIVAPSGNQSDADRIAPRHKAVAVVLDLRQATASKAQ
jgi:hypothetical protein